MEDVYHWNGLNDTPRHIITNDEVIQRMMKNVGVEMHV